MDEAEKALLRRVQDGIPLVPRPFAELGRAEGEALARLRGLANAGLLREIAAVLDGGALGWDSALVTGSVPAARLDEVGRLVAAHPTVTHDYAREHACNLWFTIATPPGSRLEDHLAALARLAGVEAFWPLRQTALFKLGVRFDPDTLANASTAGPRAPVAAFRPGVEERAMLRALQRPLPLVEAPFAVLAEAAGVDEATLLAFARAHLGGVLRKYAATVRHRALGVRANGMAAWDLDGDALAEAGARLGSEPEVSHCYARTPCPAFPYRLFAMLHGPEPLAVRERAAALAARHGLGAPLVLFSVREFKKARLRYFEPELAEWCAAQGVPT